MSNKDNISPLSLGELRELVRLVPLPASPRKKDKFRILLYSGLSGIQDLKDESPPEPPSGRKE
jgi:hypothetical protein